MTGSSQIFGLRFVGNCNLNSGRTILGGNARRNTTAGFDGNSKSRSKGRAVFLYHEGQIKLIGPFFGEGQTD